MKLSRISIILFIWVLAAGVWAEGMFGAVYVTDEAGTPLPARVMFFRDGEKTREFVACFTNDKGLAFPPQDYAAGPVSVEVTRGPEWSYEVRESEYSPVISASLTVVLKRLIDLPSLGYWQGDSHMHSTYSDGAQKPADVAWNARCEGLQWAFLTDHGQVAGHSEFMSAGAEDFLPLGGCEVTTSAGHFLALGVTSVVSNDVSHGAQDATRIFKEIHDQGGLSFLAHPQTPTMNYDYWQVSDYDGIEILNGSLAPYKGFFDGLQARLKWHSLLSQGRRIPVIGNSDNHDNYSRLVGQAMKDPEAAIKQEPLLGILWSMPNREEILFPWAYKGLYLGIYRTGLQLDEYSQQGVLSAMKAGRGFVTNGPIIVATVDNLAPGNEVKNAEVTLKYLAVCNRGLQRLDIIVDGKVAQSIKTTDESASGEIKVPLSGAQWMTVEAYGPWPEFATTNAWYVKQ